MKTKFLLICLLSISITFAQETQTDQLTKAKQIANDFLTEHKIPGMSISVAKNGALIWSEGFGISDIKTNAAVDPSQTQFRIASISKPITAYGLAILVDRGQLNFDESIYTYIPDFPKKKYDFTVRQVGGHIAGIRHYKGTEFIMNKKMSILEGLDIFKNDSLLFKPGLKSSYSTYGWNLLSVVIQNAAKTEFNKFMIEHLFNPLKMDNTRLDVSDQEMPKRTKFYLKTNQGKILPGPRVSNEFKAAGGGFVATSEDLIKFGNDVLHPHVISKEQRDELIEEQFTNAGVSVNYGIGFVVGKAKNGHPKYAHSGGGVGASTMLLMYPKEDLIIVILTNLSSVPAKKLGDELESVFIEN